MSLNVCMCYTGGVSPVKGGGIASVIANIVNETKGRINYTLVTSFDQGGLKEARSIYNSSVRIVSLRSSSNFLLNSFHWLKAPTNNFDIVHFHDLPIGRDLTYAIRLRLNGCALVFSHHFRREDTKYFPLNYRAGREYYRLSFACLSRIWKKIIVNSKFMLQDLKQYSNCVSKATIIPNGVNVEKIQESQPVFLVGDPSVLFVGHLEWHKGVDLLLNGFNQLLKEKSFQDAHLHLVGSGRMELQYRSYIMRKGLRDRVHFWGVLPQNSMFRLLRSCDIFVLPSRYEASPIVLLEAMAAEKPIVCTKVGGIPEILVEKRNALLVQPEEIGLIRAIRHLWESEDLRKILSENNRKDVCRFSWKKISKEYEDLYMSVANV